MGHPYLPQGLERFKHRAKRLVRARLSHFNQVYGFSWKRVSIRDQRSRWGSCSSNGTLCFNWRLIVLPEPLADYVIVHELCHLKHLNHSRAFWHLVERAIPDHHHHRRALRLIERQFSHEQAA